MARILLVDDDDALRKMLRLSLVKMNHEVIEARNGIEALQHCETAMPQLILLDIIMPDKEGLETISDVRRRHPALKIIAMSGGSRIGPLDYLKIAKQMGAVRTLDKPFSMAALSEAITAALA